MESVGNGITNVGKKVSVVSAAVTGMGIASVKTAADFESSMSQVQATMGITKDSMSNVNGESVNTMEALSDLAKQMGSETAFSASECAEALNYLALAGYDTQEMVDTLPTVLNLAAAGNIDLASASDMVTDAMSALGMETSEADTMVDQMAKTASSTNTSVSQLGEGILTIGATAKSIKGGTAELNTALGILANNGIKGAEGGTHLRNVILSLQNPTDKAAACMEQLGVDVYDSQGNMRSLNDILGDLNTSMEGMTSAEKTNIISSIFNKTDLSSVNALLANTGETWDSLQNSITNSAGAAQQMADTQLDNLSGQLTILKSALEGLAISIGEALMPMVKNIVSKIQGFVTWLNNLNDGTKQVIVKIGLFVAALGPALVILGTVISKVGVAMQAFSKFGLKITSLVSKAGGLSGVMSKVGTAIMGINPIVIAVVAAIAVLVGAFVHLWNTNEEFRNKIIAIWERIKGIFAGFAQGITDRLNALGFDFENFSEVVSAIWEGLCNFLAPLFEGVFTQIANILEGVLGVITGLLDVFIGIFTGNWSQVWEGVKGIFGSVWDFIKNTFTNYMNIIRNVADVVLGWFGTSWNEVWTGIRDFFVNLWTGIVDFFTSLWEGIKNTVQTAIMFIAAILEAAFDIITLPFRFIWENCKEIIIAVWDAIKEKVSGAINAISTVVSTVMNAIKTVFTTVWNAIKTHVTTVAIAKALDDEGVPTKRGGKWTSTSVRGILANEKYTGDVIFQKTYTDDSFNRHTNKGELDMYYVADHHEAIISKEDFKAARLLITQRAAEKGIKRESQIYQQRYAFSGKIICNECGDTFRRRLHSSTYGKYVAWCCNTHLADKDKCSMMFLRDDDLKVAFVTVLNKLIYSHKLVLKPYADALQNNSGDESLVRIQHLERLLEQNTEQRETLTRLMAQGYIDQVLYNSETNALLAQANTYREDIEVINATMSGDSSRFFEAERLLHFAERGSMLEEYSEDLFERFVDHIQVYSRQEVGFVMKCGLTFKEMI